MSKGQKRIQERKLPLRRCNIEHCANPTKQNPFCMTCKKFIENYKKGLTPFNCFWYCQTEEYKKKRLEYFEKFKEE